MRKRFFAAALILTLAFAVLAGCGNEDNGEPAIAYTPDEAFGFDAKIRTVTKFTGGQSEVNIPPEIGDTSVVRIGVGAFSGNQRITSVTIPDSVTDIAWNAFRDCTSLASVTTGNGATIIGDSAFSGCTSLVSVEIGDGVTIISDFAFRNCTSLVNVTIPDSVTKIGVSAFGGCTSLLEETRQRILEINPDAWFEPPVT